jgi:HEAT repeat protein
MSVSKRPDVSRLKHQEDILGLVEALKHEDDEIREQAAAGITYVLCWKDETGNRSRELASRGLDPLIDALKDRNVHVRRDAAEALGRIKCARAVPSLIAALEDESDQVRFQSISALGKMRDHRAVDPLIARLRQDNDYGCRIEAAEALKELEAREAEDALLFVLDSPVPASEASDDQVISLKKEVIGALGRIRSRKSAKALLRIIRGDDRGLAGVASDAMSASEGIIDDDMIAELISGLDDANEEVRKRSLNLLGKARIATAVDAIILRLGDRRLSVRFAAAEALGQIKARKAVQSLIQLIQDKDMGFSAARALGEIGDSEAVRPLIQALKSKRESVGENAAVALGKIKSPDALRPLIKSLKAKGIRRSAASALRNFNDSAAREALRRIQDASQGKIRCMECGRKLKKPKMYRSDADTAWTCSECRSLKC